MLALDTTTNANERLHGVWNQNQEHTYPDVPEWLLSLMRQFADADHKFPSLFVDTTSGQPKVLMRNIPICLKPSPHIWSSSILWNSSGKLRFNVWHVIVPRKISVLMIQMLGRRYRKPHPLSPKRPLHHLHPQPLAPRPPALSDDPTYPVYPLVTLAVCLVSGLAASPPRSLNTHPLSLGLPSL